jgi:glucose-6-phosphate isomerase
MYDPHLFVNIRWSGSSTFQWIWGNENYLSYARSHLSHTSSVKILLHFSKKIEQTPGKHDSNNPNRKRHHRFWGFSVKKRLAESLNHARHGVKPIEISAANTKKTKGHYHPENLAGTGYPELYDVLDGTAHFLLQTTALDDVVLIEAQQGDIMVIPPGYGHVTINPTPDQTLAMANLVSTAFSSDYRWYETMHGAAYYELTGGGVLKNPAYPGVPPVRRVRNIWSMLSDLGIGDTLYDFVGNDRIAHLLNHPENYLDFLSGQLRRS